MDWFSHPWCFVANPLTFNRGYPSQEITLQSNRILVVFPLRESCLVHAKKPGKVLLVQIDMLSQKAELLTAKPVRFLKDGNSRDVHQFVHLKQDRVHVAAFPALNELDIQKDEIA